MRLKKQPLIHLEGKVFDCQKELEVARIPTVEDQRPRTLNPWT